MLAHIFKTLVLSLHNENERLKEQIQDLKNQMLKTTMGVGLKKNILPQSTRFQKHSHQKTHLPFYNQSPRTSLRPSKFTVIAHHQHRTNGTNRRTVPRKNR